MQGRSFIAARAVVAAGSVALVVLGLSAVPASAGKGEVGAPLTIVKTVTGPVPAGTTFTATVQCNENTIDNGDSGTDTATVSFDATGQPTTPDVINFFGESTCTVTETVTGGASSTTYACEGTLPETPLEGPQSVFPQQVEPPSQPVCETPGPQSSPMTVNIEQVDQTATVTIHNTFVAPTPQAAPQVVAQPTFTG